jgi:uncharacterized membrane protein
MSISSAFIKKTLIGGIFFLVPVAVIIIVGAMVITSIPPTAEQIVAAIGPTEFRPFMVIAAIVIALVAAAFIAGLLASTVIDYDTLQQPMLPGTLARLRLPVLPRQSI